MTLHGLNKEIILRHVCLTESTYEDILTLMKDAQQLLRIFHTNSNYVKTSMEYKAKAVADELSHMWGDLAIRKRNVSYMEDAV